MAAQGAMGMEIKDYTYHDEKNKDKMKEINLIEVCELDRRIEGTQ